MSGPKKVKLDDLQGIDRLIQEAESQDTSLSAVFNNVLSVVDKGEKIKRMGELITEGMELVLPQKTMSPAQQRSRWMVLVGLAFLAGLGLGYVMGKGNVKI